MSRFPLEQMIASLRLASTSPNDGTNGVSTVPGADVVVMAFSLLSHAAVWLGQPRDVRELLGRLLGEQREQRPGRDPSHDADPPQRGGLALVAVVRAEEADRLPVLVGEL